MYKKGSCGKPGKSKPKSKKPKPAIKAKKKK